MAIDDHDDAARRWARFRFSVVGPLLAAPPGRGELRFALEQLAAKTWTHPTMGEPVSFGVSTIERWYYAAKNEPRDPVNVLRRKIRNDAGEQPSMATRLRDVLQAQHREHPQWSMQLHYDNLLTLARQDTTLGEVPSYATVRRYMHAHALTRKRPPSKRTTPGAEQAAARLEQREVRSYEATHVGGLAHSDFHEGSREVLEPDGRRYKPKLYGLMDDRSRLAAHAQWYLDETADTFVHGTSQGFMKYGLWRSLMTDGGAAMKADETRRGLEDLGVIHEMTLPLSPYQNGKQESFWNQVERRLLAMLDGVEELTLDLLNEATQAWVHLEYNRRVHSEIGATPLSRFLEGPSVLRPCPDAESLRRAFRRRVQRTQRRSDGTVSLEGVRFEIPSRFRQHEQVTVRYARWDLTRVELVDPRPDVIVARLYPVDKQRNADGRRRVLEPVESSEPVQRSGKVAPLLAELMKTYAATGLPPAYLPRGASMDDPHPENDS
jgi:transposase InsO family protein